MSLVLYIGVSTRTEDAFKHIYTLQITIICTHAQIQCAYDVTRYRKNINEEGTFATVALTYTWECHNICICLHVM